MDAVEIWKAVSIGVTGGFGVLSLLTEVKEKDSGRLTRWGRATLGVILASTIAGVGFQLKESSDAAEAQAKTSAQTLSIVQATQRTVHDVSRLLSPITQPRISLVLSANCGSGPYSHYCDKLKIMDRGYKWKNGRRNVASIDSENEYISLKMCIFRKPPDVGSRELCEYAQDGDLHYSITAGDGSDELSPTMYLSEDKTQLQIMGFGDERLRAHSNGTISSTLDFPGSTLVLRSLSGRLNYLRPVSLTFRFEDGRNYEVELTKMKSVKFDEEVVYYSVM